MRSGEGGEQVLMIAVVVFIRPVGVLTQTVFAVLILFLSYTLQIIYGPYLDRLMDRIEVASLLVNLLTLVSTHSSSLELLCCICLC